jgi:hypothetical protein
MALAFDKKAPNADIQVACDASARTIDEQGFLHVEVSNISKATINPYIGQELDPEGKLGLNPAGVYQILRPAEELAKAVATFNELPLMDVHIPVSAFDLMNPQVKRHMVGTTGSNAQFNDPYLQNSLTIWTAAAIEGVQSKEQTELSCAYRYDIDMTPGDFQGEHYDGRMSNIRGNHVAIVVEGRAGPDVVVQDSKPAALAKAEQVKNTAAHVVALSKDSKPKGAKSTIAQRIKALTSRS